MHISFRGRWLIVSVVALALILTAAIFIGKQLGDSQQATLNQARVAADHASVATLKASAFASCYRSNQQRRAINKSTDGIYRAFVVNGTLEIAASNVGKDKKRKQIERNSGQSIVNAANTLQYLPLTDCKKSITHPSTYKLAAPIPYAQYLATRRAHVRRTQTQGSRP